MICFDTKDPVPPGESSVLEADGPLDTKLVMLDWPITVKQQQEGFVITEVRVWRSADDLHLNFIVKVRNFGIEEMHYKVDGLVACEVRVDPETGNVISRLQRDGSWV